MMDKIIQVKDSDLIKMRADKGGWKKVDKGEVDRLLSHVSGPIVKVPGGSTVNVMKGIAHLGCTSAMIGKVGSDPIGKELMEKLVESGIHPKFVESDFPSGLVLSFVTPDGERTMRLYPGSEDDYSYLPLNDQDFEGIKLFHICGYYIPKKDNLTRAAKIAKSVGCKVSIVLPNFELVREHKTFLTSFIKDYVDIVICNETEIEALTGFKEKVGAEKLAELCEIAVVTFGKKGSLVQKGKQRFFTPPRETIAVDSTGAGDLFASGFLYGYLRGESLMKCCWIGNLVGSYCVETIGAQLSEDVWAKIRSKLAIKEPAATI